VTYIGSSPEGSRRSSCPPEWAVHPQEGNAGKGAWLETPCASPLANQSNSVALPPVTAGDQGITGAQFQAQVNALATDPRVYCYYIVDEPYPILLPTVVAEIVARPLTAGQRCA
jgi:hypothetical protein